MNFSVWLPIVLSLLTKRRGVTATNSSTIPLPNDSSSALANNSSNPLLENSDNILQNNRRIADLGVPEVNAISPHPQLAPGICGQRKQGLTPVRPGNNSEALYGEFPWMVALLQRDAEGKNIYLCGGSLIHQQVVLTGAHCVQGKNNLVIRAGEWDMQSDTEMYPTQDRNVSEVIIHEQFNNRTLLNDVALLILEEPVDTSVDEGPVGLICLPEENEDMDGRDCIASGWGKHVFGEKGKYSVILKKVDLPIVPRASCREALQKTRLGPKFKLHPSFICAGGVPGIDTCQGDGGSPLACPSKADSKVYVQAGIVAWGINCGTELPATYVNVPAFVPWIQNQLQKHAWNLMTVGKEVTPYNRNSSSVSPPNNNGENISTDPETTNNSVLENSTSSPYNENCGCIPFYLCDIHSTGDEVDKDHKCERDYDVCCKFRSLPKVQRNITAPVALQGNTTAPVIVQDNVTSPGMAQDNVPPPGMGQDNVRPPGMAQDNVTSPGMAQDNVITSGLGQDNVTPPEMVQGNLTPSEMAQDNVTAHGYEPKLKGCGHRNRPAFPIRGLNDSGLASYGEFPWMVALLKTDVEGKKIYLCGGSLIHPRVVLTGAHCVQGKDNLLIRAGEWDTQTDEELYPIQDRNVSEVIIHKQFNNQSLHNDMALLILEEPVDTSVDEGHVGVICLPEENEEMVGRDCVANGWGKDRFGRKGQYSVILKKVDLPVVERTVCEQALRTTRLGSHFKLHSSLICAGGILGIDTCLGDGGSPLACPSKVDPNVYVQAGIVAWGIGCGTEVPATYVNVPAFVPWIHNQLQQHGISLT